MSTIVALKSYTRTVPGISLCMINMLMTTDVYAWSQTTSEVSSDHSIKSSNLGSP